MVVLESHIMNPVLGGTNGGPNQYLQPDYLSSFPTTLDSKKSPLALLVQTCSQIGADSPTKFDTSSKRKSSLNIESTKCELDSPFTSKDSRPNSNPNPNQTLMGMGSQNPKNGKVSPTNRKSELRTSPNLLNLTQSNSNSKDNSNPKSGVKRPRSSSSATSTSTISSSPVPAKSQKVDKVEKPRESVSTLSPNSKDSNSDSESKTKEKSESKETNKRKSPTMDPQGANPIIRSGLEVLQGGGRHPGIPMPSSLSALSNLQMPGYPSPLSMSMYEQMNHLNPAFRDLRFPLYPGGPSAPTHQQHNQFLPPHLNLNLSPYSNPGGNPYVSYTRVKTPSGGESIVPVCKDPYCTGCQFSQPTFPQVNPGLSICPAGCAQCDHQKIPYPFGAYPPSFLSQHAALIQQQQQAAAAQQNAQNAQAQSAQQRPHVCNWIVGDNYCGKRFANSEDLLQHLRTHTSSNSALSQQSAEASMSSALAVQQHLAATASSLYSSALFNNFNMAMQQQQARGYPPSQTSPLGPYGAKGGPLGVPVPPGYYPPTHPYSLYGHGPRA